MGCTVWSVVAKWLPQNAKEDPKWYVVVKTTANKDHWYMPQVYEQAYPHMICQIYLLIQLVKIGVLDTFHSTVGKSNVYSLNKISMSPFPVTSRPTRKYTKNGKNGRES